MPQAEKTQLEENVNQLAEAAGKTVVEITNSLMAGAAIRGEEDLIDALLEIRQPLIQAKLDEIYNR